MRIWRALIASADHASPREWQTRSLITTQAQRVAPTRGDGLYMAKKTGPSYTMGSQHRDKIKNSNILNALIEHAEGKREMSSTQVTAGLGLLDRIMPKLATTTIEGGEKPVQVEDVGQGAVKLTAFLENIAERCRATGEPDA